MTTAHNPGVTTTRRLPHRPQVGRGSTGVVTRRNGCPWGSGWRSGVAGGTYRRRHPGEVPSRVAAPPDCTTNIVPVCEVGQRATSASPMQRSTGRSLDRLIGRLRAARPTTDRIPARVWLTPGGITSTQLDQPPTLEPRAGTWPAVAPHARGAGSRDGAAGAGAARLRPPAGVLHRDVKPKPPPGRLTGTVWVTDQLAKARGDLTGAGHRRHTAIHGPGTPRRSATRADTYALGCTLYELVALRPVRLHQCGGMMRGLGATRRRSAASTRRARPGDDRRKAMDGSGTATSRLRISPTTCARFLGGLPTRALGRQDRSNIWSAGPGVEGARGGAGGIVLWWWRALDLDSPPPSSTTRPRRKSYSRARRKRPCTGRDDVDRPVRVAGAYRRGAWGRAKGDALVRQRGPAGGSGSQPRAGQPRPRARLGPPGDATSPRLRARRREPPPDVLSPRHRRPPPDRHRIGSLPRLGLGAGGTAPLGGRRADRARCLLEPRRPLARSRVAGRGRGSRGPLRNVALASPERGRPSLWPSARTAASWPPPAEPADLGLPGEGLHGPGWVPARIRSGVPPGTAGGDDGRPGPQLQCLP